MLPPAMRPRAALLALLVLAAVALAGVAAGCGEEQTSEVAEGEPLELAGLDYAVQITRFLNPDDTEDSGYMVGQPPAKPGTSYLGVFLTIANPSDEARPVGDRVQGRRHARQRVHTGREHQPVRARRRDRGAGPRHDPHRGLDGAGGACAGLPPHLPGHTTTSATTAR